LNTGTRYSSNGIDFKDSRNEQPTRTFDATWIWSHFRPLPGRNERKTNVRARLREKAYICCPLYVGQVCFYRLAVKWANIRIRNDWSIQELLQSDSKLSMLSSVPPSHSITDLAWQKRPHSGNSRRGPGATLPCCENIPKSFPLNFGRPSIWQMILIRPFRFHSNNGPEINRALSQLEGLGGQGHPLWYCAYHFRTWIPRMRPWMNSSLIKW
jgi:hypothetical protein